MADKVWTAEELERMTPAEQDAIFESSIDRDLKKTPAAFLDKVRSRAQARITEAETHKR
ncbi:MAG: hypothetical protein H0U92_01840 [Actinobacteria bacterium]|nr:hypothetical protein [Actinomycetota bacterium]